jgi:hypothetical protein
MDWREPGGTSNPQPGKFVVAALAAVFVGVLWLLSRSDRQRQQREAFERLSRSGAIFGWDHQDTYYGVNFEDLDVGDAEVELLKVFTDFDSINLDRTRVTDEGLRHIAGLRKLHRLNLAETRVTDAGLAHLRGLDELKLLGLRGTQVTDAGLDHLRHLTRLQLLNLAGTRVTDAGLQKLATLKGLQELYMAQTGVTEAGLKQLQAALPDVRVDRTRMDWKPD